MRNVVFSLFSLAILLAPRAWSGPAMIPDFDAGDRVGKAAPDASLKTLDGKDFSLSALRGKVVVVNFWASWCGPCRSEMPDLNIMSKELKGKGVVVVGVNLDREASAARGWLSANPADFTIVLDPESRLAGGFSVASMPTSFLIDRKGVVRKKIVGYIPDELKAMKAMASGL